MASAARKSKADSGQAAVAKATKSRKSTRKPDPDILMLDADLRIDNDRWGELNLPDSEKVQLIAAAFATNKIPGEVFAEDEEPAAVRAKSEAARQHVRELLNPDQAPATGADDRIGRVSIASTSREFDAVLETKLRDIVRETMQEMFGGETGLKLSAGIRRMVRREIEMMIALERAG